MRSQGERTCNWVLGHVSIQGFQKSWAQEMKREHPVGWDRKERRCGVLKDKCLDLSSPPKAEPKTGTLQTGDFLGEVLMRSTSWRTGASETEKESQSKGVLLTWSLLWAFGLDLEETPWEDTKNTPIGGRKRVFVYQTSSHQWPVIAQALGINTFILPGLLWLRMA